MRKKRSQLPSTKHLKQILSQEEQWKIINAGNALGEWKKGSVEPLLQFLKAQQLSYSCSNQAKKGLVISLKVDWREAPIELAENEGLPKTLTKLVAALFPDEQKRFLAFGSEAFKAAFERLSELPKRKRS
ncbi:MAG: hypothetical protein RML36_15395 [Anaerolineae bacterium]|nr:hypothetical protein [Anaerolineae bacterium]